MALDLLLLALVGVAAGFGAARGALASAVGLGALLGAYAAALLAAPSLGPGLAAASGLPPVLGAPVAGILAFALAHVLLRLLGRWLRRVEARRVGLDRSALDRIGGAILGALRGGLTAALLAWLALLADGLRVSGMAPSLPPLGHSAAASLTGSAVEAGALAALGEDPAGRVAARLAGRPAETLAELDAVLADPRVVALREDALFWSEVEHGETDVALHRASFVRLARDTALRRRLHGLGVVDERAAEDPAAFRDAMAEVLAELGPRLRALREDPDLERLLQDPEAVAMARSGNHLGLVSDPRVRAIAARAVARP
jgi:uncharacterized membrane protein required for colicin V production